MNKFSLYLFEIGLPNTIPHFFNGMAASLLPFWGDYTLFDLILSNFIIKELFNINVIIQKYQKDVLSTLFSKWKNKINQVIEVEDNIFDIITYIQQDEAEYYLFSSTSFVAHFEIENIIEIFQTLNEDIIKISINNIPLDLYVFNKKRLIEIFQSNSDRNKIKQGIKEVLFDDILHTSFDRIVNIDGIVFFQNNLIQLYQGNSWLIKNSKNILLNEKISKINILNQNEKSAYISENGTVKNSIISAGAQIDGYVENSFIFPNVTIKKNAVVKNSIIMNNNIIGKEANICNTLILQYLSELLRGKNNIGENVKIGGTNKIISNLEYPDQVKDGITILGINTNIPKGYKIEQGCLIGPNVPVKVIKNIKKIKKGMYIYADML